MSDVVISVENLSKQYRLGVVGTGTLSHDLNRWWAKVRGKEDPTLKLGAANDRTSAEESEYTWALRNINFEVKRGEILGIVGPNGAGKSTLLKILSRVTGPTQGRVRIKGRMASLLEVGTGFHPELTGRENIYLNGAIMGMSKTEIRRKFDEIVDFSGCKRYVDTPVKRYSSGMTVRLGFSVAAHLKSDILIVDEVLAVGDVAFQERCIDKMENVAETGRTVLFVSHNLASVKRLCDNAVLLNQGKIQSRDNVQNILALYYNDNHRDIGNRWTRVEAVDKKSPKLIEAQLHRLETGQIEIQVKVYIPPDYPSLLIAANIRESLGQCIMQAVPSASPLVHGKGVVCGRLHIEVPPLIPGTYNVDLWIGASFVETFDYIQSILQFVVADSPTLSRTFPHSTEYGHIVPPSQYVEE